MRVAYFVQTHRAPAQVLRLLSTLRRGSPEAELVVGHCPSGEPLDEDALARLGAVVFRPERPARRGYWSLLEPYFAAVELLERRRVEYDWLVYLSGQDYPVQPLAASEARLAASDRDGYLTFRPVEAVSDDGRRHQGRRRYFYRYRDLPRAAPLLRVLRRLNGVQPWWHVHLTYGPRLGVHARRTPFGPGLRPHVGSQWTTLRRACALEVLAAARDATALVEHFSRTVCPDEAFVQTVLLAAPGLRLANDNLRYVDVRGSRDGRPRVLGRADAPALVGGRFAFARKFDAEVDPHVLDWLDREILGGSDRG